jgi:phosphoglycerate dehydrogenase-like enzyme
MKVVLSWYATEKEAAQFRAVLPPGSTLFVPPPRPSFSRYEVQHEDLAVEIADADILIGWVLPEGILAKAERLKAIIWCHAGCDELDFPTLKKKNVIVANIGPANAIAVAEHAMALLLASAKRIVVKHQAVLDAHWEPPGGRPEYAGSMLQGKTVLVIGLGSIGSAIAKRCAGFEMKVIGVRRHADRGHDVAETVYGPTDLKKALSLADFIVLAAPLTKETTYLIGETALAAMKPGAFLVNIARGNLVKEDALYAALTSNRLAGYASDVWWFYSNALPATYHFPIPSRSGLQRLKLVTATGNQAASGIADVKEVFIIREALKNLTAFISGKPMPNQIDLDLGY